MYSRSIHGSFRLPRGYTLATVPMDADFTAVSGEELSGPEYRTSLDTVSCNYSVVKVLVGLGQAIYAGLTLYETRGNQIEVYGYAAFGLTVSPYLVMSVVNLIGNLISPEYSTMYLVNSSIMEEATRRPGCYFDGVVGRLAEFSEDDEVELVTLNGPSSNCVVPRWGYVDFTYRYVDQGESPEAVTGDLSTLSPPPGELVHKSNKFSFQLRGEHQSQEGKSSQDLVYTIEKSGALEEGARVLWIPCYPLLKKRPLFGKVTSRYIITGNAISESLRPSITTTSNKFSWNSPYLRRSIAIFIALLPLAITGGLSRFRSGSSTLLQRIWTMLWLVWGIWVPFILNLYEFFSKNHLYSYYHVLVEYFTLLVCFTPAIGGVIVVGQMLHQYGSCVSLS
jgi:hypothetical protein